jgi:predicted permease
MRSAPDPTRRDSADAELRFHLDARARDLMRRGMAADEARARARREFGDVEETCRYMDELDERRRTTRRGKRYMDDFRQDVRIAFRRLRAAPAFTLAAILTIALGVGANAAVFSVVYSVLLRPLPFPDADRLYAIYHANRTGNLLEAGVSPLDLDDWRAGRRALADLGGYFYQEGSSGLALTGRGRPRQLSGVFFTPGFFSTLGIQAVRGRLPREDEMVRGGHDRIALLSHGFWQREFGGVDDAIGSTLTLSGEPFEVIGVLPADFRFPTERADLFIPYSTIPDSAIPRLRVVRVLSVVGRARPGVGQAGVEAEMGVLTRRLAEQFPENRAWDAASVVPLREVVVGPVRQPLLVLFAAVGLVLLMACVNVAGLQLARAASRQGEMAIRLAIGARRGRLVRQLMTESLVLASLGGLAGLALARPAVAALVTLSAGQLPRAAEVGLNPTVVLFTLATTALVGVLFGLAPALSGSRQSADASLRGSRGTAGPGSHRLRSGLVVAEVAVAMMLVVGAGLMIRSFQQLLNVDVGFRPDHLIAVQFTLNADRYEADADPAEGFTHGYARVYHEIIERVRALPGVQSAAAVKDPPFRGNGERNGFRVAGRPVPAGQDPPTATAIHVSDGYFATIGAPIVDGREFTPDDRANTPTVFVINEAFAREFFPGERAVGKHLDFGRIQPEIVGVVHDIRQVAVAEPARPTVYIDNLQNTRVKTTIVARAAGDPLALVDPIRQVVWSVDPEQPIADVFTFDAAVSRALARPRLLMVLLGLFGAIGLALGAIGIYGVLASLVSERRREIGVRLALGAPPASISSLVLRRGAILGGVGIGAGLTGALAGRQFLATVLYGVTPGDPGTLLTVAAVLLGAVLLASWLPARRAAHVDPVQTLRSE